MSNEDLVRPISLAETPFLALDIYSLWKIIATFFFIKIASYMMAFAASPTKQNMCEYRIHIIFRTHRLPYITTVVFHAPISFCKFNHYTTVRNTLYQLIEKLPQKASARNEIL